MEQVNSSDAPASAVGAVISCVMTTLSVAVQPLSLSVTVTVYVPGASTVGVAVLSPAVMLPPTDADQA